MNGVLDSWTSLGGSMFDATISACRSSPGSHLDAADRRRYRSDAPPKKGTVGRAHEIQLSSFSAQAHVWLSHQSWSCEIIPAGPKGDAAVQIPIGPSDGIDPFSPPLFYFFVSDMLSTPRSAQ